MKIRNMNQQIINALFDEFMLSDVIPYVPPSISRSIGFNDIFYFVLIMLVIAVVGLILFLKNIGK